MREAIGPLRRRLRAEVLRRGGNPRDVDLLLSDLTGRSTAWIFSHEDEDIDAKPLLDAIARREAGEPIQYIRGRTEFFSREFSVDPRVLIPRPETELLVETVLDLAPPGATVVDIGTGSGCIAISLERTRRDLRVAGIDRSIAALAVAARNRDAHASGVRLFASDLLDSVRGPIDVIVSNPPYIPRAEYEALERVVRDHEPEIALTPGPEGTEIITRILSSRRAPLVVFEIGFGQETAVRSLAQATGYQIDRVLPDLAGIPRVVISSRHGDK